MRILLCVACSLILSFAASVWAAPFSPAGSPPPGSVTFSIGSEGLAEADGSVTLVVQRLGGSAGAVSVDYATNDGSAIAPDD